MPTPRQHGGSALTTYSIQTAQFRGLDTQHKNSLIGEEWATRLRNTVLDQSSRICSRGGFSSPTTTDVDGHIKQVVEFDNSGTLELVACTDDDKLFKSVDDGVTWTDITGASTVTDPNMKLVQIGVSGSATLLGFQDGDNPVKYTGSGNFADHSPTNIATGDVAVAAFGRIFAKHSASVVRYCALLDEDDWDGSDTGSIDVTTVWRDTDEITALAEFNGRLVIFGKKNIIVYSDGTGSELGIDPVNIEVVDTISGIGCIARDSVVQIKGDLWFLDDTGIHSLGRIIQEKSNPITNISSNIRDDLIAAIAATTANEVRAVYSPKDRFYLLSLPAGSGASETGLAYCFDTQGYMEDGTARCTGLWDTMVPNAAVVRDNLDLVVAIKKAEGKSGVYSGYSDNGDAFFVDYESGWMDMQNPYIKILKRMTAIFQSAGDVNVRFKWAYDFNDSFRSELVPFTGAGDKAEYGIAEFGLAEFGSPNKVNSKSASMSGAGQYLKIGFSYQAPNSLVCLQNINLYTKIGRLT